METKKQTIQQTGTYKGASVPAGAGNQFDGADLAAAVFALAVGYFYARFFGGIARPLGKLVLVAFTFLFTALWGKHLGKKFNRGKDWLIPLVTVVLSAGFIITSVPSVRLLSALCVLGAYVYWVGCWMGGSAEGMPGDLCVFEGLRSAFAVPMPALGRIFPVLFNRKRGKNAGLLLWILLGIAVAIIPTVIVTLLLAYDSFFTQLLHKIGLFISVDVLLARFGSFILGVPCAMYVFALLSGHRRGERTNQLSPASHTELRRKIGFAPAPMVAAALTPILVIYVIYFISQIDNYLLPLLGSKPDGAFYAEFARNGFFQLCAVAAINGLLLGITALFIRRRENGRSPILRIYAALYALSTLILIATALAKMILYVHALGFTRNRLLTCFFMVWLAVVFAAVLAKTVCTRVNGWAAAVVAGVLLLGTLGLTDMDRIIVTYNGNAYLEGRLAEFDVDLLYDLDEGAVAPAMKLYNDSRMPSKVKSALADYLAEQAREIKLEETDRGLWCFSVPRYRAKQALNKNGFWEKAAKIESDLFEDVTDVTVSRPDDERSLELSADEISQFTALLKEAQAQAELSDCKQEPYEVVYYYLSKADGTAVSIECSEDRVFVDGVGYLCDGSKLRDYGHSLLNTASDTDYENK